MQYKLTNTTQQIMNANFAYYTWALTMTPWGVIIYK